VGRVLRVRRPLGGPSDWCVESGSVHAECQRLIDHDVEVHGPSRGSRERPDGTVVEWDNAFLGPPDEHLLPFVVSDRTPREYRVPDSELYGSPVSGIAWVVLATDDMERTVDRFERLYRFPPRSTTTTTSTATWRASPARTSSSVNRTAAASPTASPSSGPVPPPSC